MLLLAGANDKYELTTSAAGDIDITAHFMDSSNADPPVVKGSTASPQVTTMTTATTTTVVTAPGASVVRAVSAITIRNTHATVANDVTFILDRSATDYELYKTNLLPGESLTYEDGLGWFKNATGFDNTQYVRKTAQQTFAATSFADVTGMGFAVAANAVYEFEYDVQFRSATVTVGVGLAVNGPASPTSVQGSVIIIGAQAAGALTDVFSAGFVAYDTPNLTTLTTNSTSVTYSARLSCLLENGGTAGTIIPRWRSETATNTTVEVGSFGTCKRIG